MSLAVDYYDIARAVGRYLGWGRDPKSDWDASNKVDFSDILKRGLTWFYHPHTIPGQRLSHRWTFLRPVHTIDLGASISQYEMPEEFDGTIDSIRWSGDTTTWTVVELTSLYRLHQKQNESPSATGSPQWCAIEKHRGEGEQAQKQTIHFHPKPDTNYQVKMVIGINPGVLTEDRPIPWGSNVHSETILAACEAAAESLLVDGETLKRDIFLTCLQSSISHDTTDAPHTLGYCDAPEIKTLPYSRAGTLSYNPLS